MNEYVVCVRLGTSNNLWLSKAIRTLTAVMFLLWCNCVGVNHLETL